MTSTIDFATADIRISEVLHRGEFAEVFLVSVDSLECVMKVVSVDSAFAYGIVQTLMELKVPR